MGAAMRTRSKGHPTQVSVERFGVARHREDGAVKCWIAAVLVAAALPLPCHAGAGPVERPDGAVEVVVDGGPITLTAPLAQAVAAAVAEHGNDPDGLAAALRELLGAEVCDTASSCERLAAAAVVYAVSESSGESDVIAAIVRAVAAAVPAARTEALLAAVGSADGRPGAPAGAVQATAEPPRSASPTQ